MSVQLIHGDCIQKMKDLSDNSVDIVITDLPYGMFHKKKRENTNWDHAINLNDMWRELWRVGKKNCPIFMFADMRFAATLINSQPKWFKYDIAWIKNQSTNPMNMKYMFGKATEYILVFYKKRPTYNVFKYHKVIKELPNEVNGGILGRSGVEKYTKRYYEPKLPLNVINCGNVHHKNKLKCGITEKPVQIMEHLLKYYSNEGDTCLDICMGSGSTGEACLNMNRNFIGIELNDKHFEICEKRLKK